MASGGRPRRWGVMSSVHRPGPMLVGVNDEPSSDLALRWAMSDARTLGVAVKLVHAFSGIPRMREPMYRDIPDADLEQPRHVAEQLVAKMVDQAREIDPDVLVEGDAIEGGASRVLVQEASSATALVVGSRHLTALRSAVLGSVGRCCGWPHRMPDDRRARTGRTAGRRRSGRGWCRRYGQGANRPSGRLRSCQPASGPAATRAVLASGSAGVDEVAALATRTGTGRDVAFGSARRLARPIPGRHRAPGSHQGTSSRRPGTYILCAVPARRRHDGTPRVARSATRFGEPRSAASRHLPGSRRTDTSFLTTCRGRRPIRLGADRYVRSTHPRTRRITSCATYARRPMGQASARARGAWPGTDQTHFWQPAARAGSPTAEAGHPSAAADAVFPTVSTRSEWGGVCLR